VWSEIQTSYQHLDYRCGNGNVGGGSTKFTVGPVITRYPPNAIWGEGPIRRMSDGNYCILDYEKKREGGSHRAGLNGVEKVKRHYLSKAKEEKGG